MNPTTCVPLEYQSKAMASGTRRENGSIGIEAYRGKLRLRLPRELFGGKQKVIYSRLPDTKDGWKEAQKQVWGIEDDIARGEFDPALAKYQPNIRLTVVQPTTQLTLLDL